MSSIWAFFGFNAANRTIAEHESQLKQATQLKQQLVQRTKAALEHHQQKIQMVHTTAQNHQIKVPIIISSTPIDPLLTDKTIQDYHEIVVLKDILKTIENGQLESDLKEKNENVGELEGQANLSEKEVRRLSELNNFREDWNYEREKTAQQIDVGLKNANCQ